MRFGQAALPLHEISEIKSFNKIWVEPSFQAQFPDGLYLCMFSPGGQWIYHDCKKDDEWAIYAAPTPAYLAELVDKVGDLESETRPLEDCRYGGVYSNASLRARGEQAGDPRRPGSKGGTGGGDEDAMAHVQGVRQGDGSVRTQ